MQYAFARVPDAGASCPDTAGWREGTWCGASPTAGR